MKCPARTTAGNLRITAGEHTVNALLWPILTSFLATYPNIIVEVMVNITLTVIVAGRFDAGNSPR